MSHEQESPCVHAGEYVKLMKDWLGEVVYLTVKLF
jgi:hypothetical protein